MSTRINLMIGSITLAARLNDTPTAQAILGKLPITGASSVWGQEIYFPIPVDAEEAGDAREEVAVGTLAYWPPGKAFCVFYGPTPVSRGAMPRAYSPVNVVGEVLDDCAPLRTVRSGTAVRIERA